MALHYLSIAGTSIGGSSYMNRVVDILVDKPADTQLLITIGVGDKQAEVYKLVANHLLKLHRFIAQTGGSVKNPISLAMEPSK